MLKLLSSNPFLMPIHELDGRAQDGWNIFQSIILRSASKHKNISFNDSVIVDPTIYYSDLIANRPFGVSAVRQQIALQNFMIYLDESTALAIFTSL